MVEFMGFDLQINQIVDKSACKTERMKIKNGAGRLPN